MALVKVMQTRMYVPKKAGEWREVCVAMGWQATDYKLVKGSWYTLSNK